MAFVKDKLASSEMIFSIPSETITVHQAERLRACVPEGTTVSLVKNTLMSRAVTEDPAWTEANSMLKGTNLWFFIESDISGTLGAFNKFLKTEELKDRVGINGGVLEAVQYDADGIVRIGKLPSKLELIARIAGGINAVPTKLARVVKAPGDKLARAIKLGGETLAE